MAKPTPRIDVPSRDEFDALKAQVDNHETRLNALEGQAPTTPPDPGTGSGTKARRIADVIGLFGVNTFSSMDEGNLWGSWPADYRPEQVIAALNYLTGDSGHTIRIREYHYAGREAMQRQWIAAIKAALPDTPFAMCVAANGNTRDVPTMLSMQDDVVWFEGLNEPNTDFGSGMVPVEHTMAIQNALWGKTERVVMGPSVVAGMPHPEGWITGYFGPEMSTINTQMEWGNGHYYPPGCPDLTGDGTSLSEYVGGLWQAYGQHSVALTEFHSTLYNSAGRKPDQPGWSGERDAYYALLALLRAAKCTVEGLWWYALFDYGTTYLCGLFPTNADNPRPAATAIRTLCTTCPDRGADSWLFDPGSLELSISLPERCDSLLTQSSDGTFYLFLWHSEPEPGGLPALVSVTVPFSMSMTEYDLLSGRLVSEGTGASFDIDLPATVRVLVLAI